VIGNQNSFSAREVLWLRLAIRLLSDLAAIPLKREISPLDTPKEKEKPRQTRENLCGMFLPATPTLQILCADAHE
jgi:hypothetical protein